MIPKIHVCNDLDRAESLWKRQWPRQCIFDLWPVRECFQRHYHHQPHFLVATRGHRVCGLLALSWIDEEDCFGHFPGEVWHGQTWLEQNKIVAADSASARALLDQMPQGTQIRYLCPNHRLEMARRTTEDEVGYLFFPGQYQFAMQGYWNTFTGKSRKKLNSEINHLKSSGISFRHNHAPDLEWMFRLNLEYYKDKSYFYDTRFLGAFESLAAWLLANDMLRVTTVLIGGRVAAVDMGAVWNNTYSVLAGGTHADFPGVAKMINLHHLEWACDRKIALVDFLCGDFNWKQRFHLTPRPLFQIQRPHTMEIRHESQFWFRQPSFAA
ncbi:MAG: GNAT family N-acetyltransferase [Deltaproteobacteria bacterium]|nr:GNAT family N-acetyltransferase [Deltaproteobacteria bacterium]